MSDALNGRQHTMGLPASDKLHTLLNPPFCSRCGSRMRLARIEPKHTQTQRADEITYDCVCGHLHAETVDTL